MMAKLENARKMPGKCPETLENVRKPSKTPENVETSENVEKVRFFSSEGHAAPILTGARRGRGRAAAAARPLSHQIS